MRTMTYVPSNDTLIFIAGIPLFEAVVFVILSVVKKKKNGIEVAGFFHYNAIPLYIQLLTEKQLQVKPNC